MPILLDSQLDINRCPHCNVNKPNLKEVTHFDTFNYKGSNLRKWKVYSCANCGGAVLASAKGGAKEITEMYPKSIKVSEVIPKRAKEYLEQAIDSIHAPSGAIMLAASSIDAMLKEQGYNDDESLNNRINNAVTDHLITEGMSKWAHQIRLDANAQRHADEDFELPKEEVAKNTIDFALALAEFLYVLPSKVNKGIEVTKSEKKPN
ncbi:MAG: DUF4145 domain-containing protein [Bacteroidales bacterium]|nr:DUF4145 domain-containing protein [Bacteroidales bacterium]